MIRKTKTNGEKVTVTFILPENHPYGATSVVGDFNNWNPNTHAFQKQENDTFSISVILPTGQQFRFRYLGEGGKWFDEDASDGYEPNEYGSGNSILDT